MDEGCCGQCPVLQILRSLFTLLQYLLDTVLDVLTIVLLYLDGDYVYMGVLIALLLFSSILVNTFSWMMYTGSKTSVHKLVADHHLLGPLHFFLLGEYIRLVSLVEIAIKKFQKQPYEAEDERDLKMELGMLRLFETFSESVPQLILMTIIKITQEQKLPLITGLKITASAFSIVFSFAFILHKNRVSYFPEAKKIWSSSIVYFLWNLLLMIPRVIAIALFASVLPCYIPLHFLCLWLLFFLWARMEKANILYTSQSEWLYQATVGLIWYFSWYTVSTKNTRVKNNIYHVCMGADMTLLLGLWFWRRSVESAHLGPPPVNLYVMIGVLPSLHLIGFLIKLFYYWKFNPSVLTTTVGRETHLQRKLAAMNDSVVAEIESSKQNPDQPVLSSTGS